MRIWCSICFLFSCGVRIGVVIWILIMIMRFIGLYLMSCVDSGERSVCVVGK